MDLTFRSAAAQITQDTSDFHIRGLGSVQVEGGPGDATSQTTFQAQGTEHVALPGFLPDACEGPVQVIKDRPLPGTVLQLALLKTFLPQAMDIKLAWLP